MSDNDAMFGGDDLDDDVGEQNNPLRDEQNRDRRDEDAPPDEQQAVARNRNNGRQRPQNEDQQRQRVEPRRRYPYCATRPVTRLSNVTPITSAIQSEKFSKYCNRRDMEDRVSLQLLMQVPDGDYRKSWMIGIVLAIPRARNNGNATMYNKKRGSGQAGNASNIRYVRSIRLWDPMSPSGQNVFTILEGCEYGPQLFNLDITKRDDGTFRKFLFFVIYLLVWMIHNLTVISVKAQVWYVYYVEFQGFINTWEKVAWQSCITKALWCH